MMTEIKLSDDKEKEMVRDLLTEKINETKNSIPDLNTRGENLGKVMDKISTLKKYTKIYLKNFDRRKISDKAKNIKEMDEKDKREQEDETYKLTRIGQNKDGVPVWKELIYCGMKDAYKNGKTTTIRISNKLDGKIKSSRGGLLGTESLKTYIQNSLNYSVDKNWLKRGSDKKPYKYTPGDEIESAFEELGLPKPDSEEDIQEINEVLEKEKQRYLEERR